MSETDGSKGGQQPPLSAAAAAASGEDQRPTPSPQVSAASRRFQQTQAQVDEVVGIMRTNVEKVLERDTKLSELDDRADALNQGASLFEQQAGKLKRKYWWQNLKMLAIMVVVVIVLILIFSEMFS